MACASQNGDLTAPSAPASTADALIPSVQSPACGVIGPGDRELRVVRDESVVARRPEAFHDGVEADPERNFVKGKDVAGE